MKKSPLLKDETVSASVATLGYGVELTQEQLEELVLALKPEFAKLSEADKIEAKVLAAAIMFGNPVVTQKFRERLIKWFPLPIPPFPPILWDKTGITPMVTPFVVGLLLVGIALMLA